MSCGNLICHGSPAKRITLRRKTQRRQLTSASQLLKFSVSFLRISLGKRGKSESSGYELRTYQFAILLQIRQTRLVSLYSMRSFFFNNLCTPKKRNVASPTRLLDSRRKENPLCTVVGKDEVSQRGVKTLDSSLQPTCNSPAAMQVQLQLAHPKTAPRVLRKAWAVVVVLS